MDSEKDLLSVLLVDDDPQARDIFQIVMDFYQLPLTVLKDAESAITHLQENTHDIIVMDIFLPGLDGYQALNRIRQSARVPNCKVVATTAYYTNDTAQEVASRGFDGYIPKPFSPDKLVPYLKELLKQDNNE